ncbi:MAG: S8 family serine peptidase [Acidobacteriota bacterium]
MFLVLLFLTGFATTLMAREADKLILAETNGVAGHYIVVLADDVTRAPDDSVSSLLSVPELAQRLVNRHGGAVERTWEHALRGFSIRIGDDEVRKLAADPAVAFVEQVFTIADASIFGAESAGPTVSISSSTAGSPQILDCPNPDPRTSGYDCVDNWGLDRIDQVNLPRDERYVFDATGQTAGTRVHVYTIDTGIHPGHVEFLDPSLPEGTRISRGVNVAVPDGDTHDCAGNGHGTHVAGIIGGATFGVAKEVILHPVVFYDFCDSSVQGGMPETLAAAMNWIVREHGNHPEHIGPGVVNLSGANNSIFNTPAVITAATGLLDAGLVLVQSAGNHNDASGDACVRSLGAVPELDHGVIVVGGTDVNRPLGGAMSQETDGRWIREIDDPSHDLCSNYRDCGSNSGPCVDVWAPAAHILSAANTGSADSRRVSGTSMAAPHVTGAVALYLADHPNATPAEVKAAILGGAVHGVLDDDSTSSYYIGDGSPNLLLNARLLGDGASCVGNQSPIARDDYLETTVDDPISIGYGVILSNDEDPEGGWLRVVPMSKPTSQGGTADFRVGGIYYTPPSGFVGTDSFPYTIEDDCGLTDSATVYVEITPPDIRIVDSFSGQGPLDGRLTEEGAVTWNAEPGAQLAGGTVIDSSAIAGVPIDPLVLSGTTTLRITADAEPKNAEWIGVGFADSATQAYWAGSKIWVLVRSNGQYTAFAEGESVGAGAIPNPPASGPHAIEVRYHTASQVVEYVLNGVVVEITTLTSTPVISHAGFHMYRAAHQARVDDFAVHADATVVLSDSFIGSGALDGRQTTVGGSTWSARPGATVVRGRVQDDEAIATVPFDPTGHLGDRILTFGADLDVDGVNWIGAGFTQAPGGKFWTSGSLWLILRESGNWSLHTDGLSTTVASGSVDVSSSEVVPVSIRYHTATRRVLARIGGVIVADEILGSAPLITHAGFHMRVAVEGGGKVDNVNLVSIYDD